MLTDKHGYNLQRKKTHTPPKTIPRSPAAAWADVIYQVIKKRPQVTCGQIWTNFTLLISLTFTNKHIIKVFSLFLLFHTKRCGNISTGTPSPKPGRLMQGGLKKSRFSKISRFISDMIQDRAIVTTEGEHKTVPKLLNGTSFNDLERPLIYVYRSYYYLTLNISETVQDTHIVTTKY